MKKYSKTTFKNIKNQQEIIHSQLHISQTHPSVIRVNYTIYEISTALIIEAKCCRINFAISDGDLMALKSTLYFIFDS